MWLQIFSVGVALALYFVLICKCKLWRFNKIDDKSSVDTICQECISIFDKHLRFHHKDDKFDLIGKKKMIKHLRYWIIKNESIKFCLPAFPCKSINKQEKVFSIYPDYGEYLALENLCIFCQKISSIYNKGCEILIISDGRVYGDLLCVDIQNIFKYNQCIKNMINSNGWDKHLKNTNLISLLGITLEQERKLIQENKHNVIIDQLMSYYTYTNINDEIDNLIKTDENLLNVYLGLSKFLQIDFSPWKTKISKLGNINININSSKMKSINGVKKYCQNVSKKMMSRSVAYSNLISSKLPNHIRLSIHSHDNSNKYAICLYKYRYNINYCITPWHNVVVKMLDGTILLMKKQVVQFIIDITRNGKCICNSSDTIAMHPIDRKHRSKWQSMAINFINSDKFSPNSQKTFEIVYNNDRMWFYQEKKLS